MIYTFYSYKGGVGRTMALANIAEMFFNEGMKVLMVDWDLEAPGLERFFPLDIDQTLDKPGIMDMLLGYKKQMSQKPQSLKGNDPLPFEKPESFFIDVYPDPPHEGKLWLITAGKRSQDNFAEYAKKVLNFDWHDFYQNWEGELYLDWVRDQFEKMADVVLIDSRTGVTEMGGVCTYQLADTIVMLCAANQQCLDGTYKMAQKFKTPEVKRLRGERPLNVLIIPARIERVEGDLLNKFQQDFIKLFKDSVQHIEEVDIWTLWKARIPYIPKYAFTETLAVRETGRASAEDMVEAFRRLKGIMVQLSSTRAGEKESTLKSKVSTVTKLRVFVAASGDVSEERKRLKEVIDELNQTIDGNKRLLLEFAGWETHAWPAMGEDAQDVINRQIGPYDIFIGIMWKRFGASVEGAGSGTEAEFEQAYSFWLEFGRPRIMFYFNKAPFYPDSPEENEQMAKVIDFKERIRDRGALYWEYKGLKEFEKFVRRHITREIFRLEDYTRKPPSMVPRLPAEFFRALFNELGNYITQFEQLQRDYNRELKGENLVFAVDFSEIHDYMHPYSLTSTRSSLNKYIFHTIKDPLTLMPGAVGELLIDLERALPSYEVLEHHPIAIYKEVIHFINKFPTVLNNEEKIIELYSRAENQLKDAYGELFDAVIRANRYTPFCAIKELLDQGMITPIEGIKKITHFPPDVQHRIQRVRNFLDRERPERLRNNLVDTIDFAVTWMLNTLEKGKQKRYLSIYTQSSFFINACTVSRELRWEDDYLVRGAQYLKFRTRLQEILSSTKESLNFVQKWVGICRELQKEIIYIDVLEKEKMALKKPTFELLELLQRFDEECRIPLAFTGEESENERSKALKNASKLYDLLKKKGDFRGRAGQAFDVLKVYLGDLQAKFKLFTPEKVQIQNPEKRLQNLARWIDTEGIDVGSIERIGDEK